MARGINKVILVGNLGADPETRYMPSGSAVTNLSIATSEQWKDKQSGEQKERTEWHKVAMFNRLAEIAAEYLRKGSQVYIEGKLRTRKWQDRDGNDRWTTEIIADEMQMLGGRGGGGSAPMSSGPGPSSAPPQPPADDFDFIVVIVIIFFLVALLFFSHLPAVITISSLSPIFRYHHHHHRHHHNTYNYCATNFPLHFLSSFPHFHHLSPRHHSFPRHLFPPPLRLSYLHLKIITISLFFIFFSLSPLQLSSFFLSLLHCLPFSHYFSSFSSSFIPFRSLSFRPSFSLPIIFSPAFPFSSSPSFPPHYLLTSPYLHSFPSFFPSPPFPSHPSQSHRLVTSLYSGLIALFVSLHSLSLVVAASPLAFPIISC